MDIDALELAKPLARVALPIHCDLKIFLSELLRQIVEAGFGGRPYDDLARVVP